MLKYLNDKKVVPQKSMELVSNEAVKQAINAGIGFSIVPLIGLRTALANENIRIFPIKSLPITTQWNLIYNYNKELGPAQKALIEHIEENKNHIVAEHFDWAQHEAIDN